MDSKPSERPEESDRMEAELGNLSTTSEATSRTSLSNMVTAVLEDKLYVADAERFRMFEVLDKASEAMPT